MTNMTTVTNMTIAIQNHNPKHPNEAFFDPKFKNFYFGKKVCN